MAHPRLTPCPSPLHPLMRLVPVSDRLPLQILAGQSGDARTVVWWAGGWTAYRTTQHITCIPPSQRICVGPHRPTWPPSFALCLRSTPLRAAACVSSFHPHGRHGFNRPRNHPVRSACRPDPHMDGRVHTRSPTLHLNHRPVQCRRIQYDLLKAEAPRLAQHFEMLQIEPQV